MGGGIWVGVVVSRLLGYVSLSEYWNRALEANKSSVVKEDTSKYVRGGFLSHVREMVMDTVDHVAKDSVYDITLCFT